MPHKKLQDTDDMDLAVLIDDLRLKLKKRNEDLTRTRQRLSKARSRIQKLKAIVTYQRDRIIKLTHTIPQSPSP